jgi:hypothetical protein
VAITRTTPVRGTRLSKSVTVTTDAKDAQTIKLRFSVESKATILFEPRPQFLVYAFEGEAAQSRLLLRHGDGEQLVVHSAETGSEHLDTVIRPVAEKERWAEIEARPGDVWLDLVLSPNAPLGTLSGRMQVATNHPQARSFGIQYLVRVRSVIETRPDGVRLWLLGRSENEGRSNFVRVIHNQAGDLNITSLAVSHPEFFSAEIFPIEAAGQQALRVKVTDGLTPEALGKTIEGWVEITTNVQPDVKLELPVLVAPTRAGTRRDFHQR